MPANLCKAILTVVIGLALMPPVLRAETKTLARILDPVVMTGKDLGPLIGQAPEQMALMALHAGAWEPVPFQIDQKKPDGTYAYTSGPKAGPDPDPTLDANDELVFMAKDAGDRIEKEALPAGAKIAVELELSDPKNGKKGWAYLMSFSGPPPRSSKKYVKVELDKGAKRYRFTGAQFVVEIPQGFIVPDYLAGIKEDGSLGPNVLDRVKITLKIIVNMINYSFDLRGDHLIRADTQGWIDGPVRVIHFNEGYVQVAKWIKFRMGGAMKVTLYPYNMEFPMEMEAPEVATEEGKTVTDEDAKKSPTTVNEDVYLDFNHNAYGAKFFSPNHALNPDVVFDGKMSPAEEALDRKSITEWAGLVLPQGGGLVARVNQDPYPKDKQFLPRLYYLDDKTKEDKPENEVGTSGMGLSLYHVEQATAQIPKGQRQIFTTIIYYRRDFTPDNAREFLDIQDNRLKVQTRPVGAGK